MSLKRLRIRNGEEYDDTYQQFGAFQMTWDRRIKGISHENFRTDKTHNANNYRRRYIRQISLDQKQQSGGLDGQGCDYSPDRKDNAEYK